MDDSPQSPPVTFWIIGVLTLLWDAMGSLDFTMTQLQNEAYLKGFTDEQRAYFDSFPLWIVILWGTAVWGGVVGCLLLLMRKGLAHSILGLSFVCMLITHLYNYGLGDGLEVMGDAVALGFTALIFVVSLFLWRYAGAMKRRGVLS